MTPLVSVIVPVYQTEKFIAECMDSILCQTYRNIEIILVDDGSTDTCPRLCDCYAEDNPNVRVIHKENGGLSSARNAGIDVAKGEYLTFVDSDDVIAPDMINTMVCLAVRENADIVKITLMRQSSLKECIHTVGPYVTETPDAALQRIYRDPPQIISACGKLFDKQLFKQIRFPTGLYYEDEFITPKLYHASKKIVFSEAVQYFYMQRDNESIMRSAFNRKKCEDALYMSKERIEFFRNIKDTSLEHKAIKDYYFRLKKLIHDAENMSDTVMVNDLVKKKMEFKKKHFIIAAQADIIQCMYELKVRL